MEDVLKWWATLDMNNDYLIKVYGGMFGTSEQRASQLYIIRNNLNFPQKTFKNRKKNEKHLLYTL